MKPATANNDQSGKTALPYNFSLHADFLDLEDFLSIQRWLNACDHWNLRVTSFYEQYEFSFLDDGVLGSVRQIIDRVNSKVHAWVRAPA